MPIDNRNEDSEMKWTQDYVWSKVEQMVPNAQLAGMSLPEALKAAAVEFFLVDEGAHCGSYRAWVVEACLKELREQGFITFGTIDEDWR